MRTAPPSIRTRPAPWPSPTTWQPTAETAWTRSFNAPVTVPAAAGIDDVDALIAFVREAGDVTPNQTPRATILP